MGSAGRRLEIPVEDDRGAANASARAKPGEGRRTRALSFASTCVSSAPAAAMRRSSGSTRPPGKTNLPGMNRCPACRLPISTRAPPRSGRSTRMSVAASRGRSARDRTWRDRAWRPRSRPVAFGSEAVHAQGPLLADDGALGGPVSCCGPNRREKRVSMTENYAVIGHRRSLGPPRPCGKTAATHWTKPGLVKGAIIGHVPGNTAVIWGMLV